MSQGIDWNKRHTIGTPSVAIGSATDTYVEGSTTMAKYGQKILFFFCRPCGDYHLKTHPHYRAMKRRKRKIALAKLATP